MKFINDNITKGIMFAGCSFTWGQGLYYYSNMSTLKEPPPYAYTPHLVTDSHKRYAATLRYPRLVANYFNTFEVVSKQNGGSEETSLTYLQRAFGIQSAHEHLISESFSYDDIEYIVLQTSQIVRNSFEFVHKGKTWKFLPWDEDHSKAFYEWLGDNSIQFDDWAKMHYTNVYNNLKSELQFYESKGIKVLLLCWEPDYLKYFSDDIWLTDRLIPMFYNGINYITIRNLMDSNVNLHISEDYEYFKEPPSDCHPSKECHKIIAENVIKKIEEIKNKKQISYESKII